MSEVVFVEDVDTAAFQKACAGVWDQYRQTIGSDVIDECARLSAEATAKAGK